MICNRNKVILMSIEDLIYFFALDIRYPDIIKVRKTRDIIARLQRYNIVKIKLFCDFY